MAETSVSQVSFGVNDRDEIHFLSIGSMPAVLSTEVARHFQRRHSHVLRDVDRLCSILPKSFREPNFGLTFKIIPGPNGASRKEKAYLLTRDALSLLVMGMTGKAAIIWKLRYIEAFNAMEARLRDMAVLGEPGEPSREAVRESGYREGYDAGRASALPDVKAAEAKGRAAGVALGMALRPARKDKLLKVQRYMGMGLTIKEICLLLGLRKSAAYGLMHQARELGLLESRLPARPVQGNLLALDDKGMDA